MATEEINHYYHTMLGSALSRLTLVNEGKEVSIRTSLGMCICVCVCVCVNVMFIKRGINYRLRNITLQGNLSSPLQHSIKPTYAEHLKTAVS